MAGKLTDAEEEHVIAFALELTRRAVEQARADPGHSDEVTKRALATAVQLVNGVAAMEMIDAKKVTAAVHLAVGAMLAFMIEGNLRAGRGQSGEQ